MAPVEPRWFMTHSAVMNIPVMRSGSKYRGFTDFPPEIWHAKTTCEQAFAFSHSGYSRNMWHIRETAPQAGNLRSRHEIA
jgi:hypothetical protein